MRRLLGLVVLTLASAFIVPLPLAADNLSQIVHARARDAAPEKWSPRDEVRELPNRLARSPTPTPFPEATLDDLSIRTFSVGQEPEVIAVGTLGQSLSIEPGESLALVLGRYDYEVCGVGNRCFIPVAVPVSWSVDPRPGVQVDPTSGMLTVELTVPGGSVFTVRANVKTASNPVAAEVHVTTEQTNPLLGYWREEAQIACENGAEIAPEEQIEELVFAPDGTFAVTWFRFESYADYWGTYSFDLDKGTLELLVTDGNYIPSDVDGIGRFALDATDELVLTDLWLGSSPLLDGQINCGHRFIR